MLVRLAKAIFWTVTLFYAYGATVHILNIASLSGFDWPNAPAKWQTLDIVYLVLDIVVVAGLVRRWTVSLAAFYAAAVSQVVLYTVFRGWILDVPDAYAISPQQQSYLTALVAFHLVTLTLVTWAIKTTHNKPLNPTA